MSLVSVKMNGLETLERKLSEMNRIRFDAVVEMQMVDMVDRATQNHMPHREGHRMTLVN